MEEKHKHDWEFIGVVGACVCLSCGKWDDLEPTAEEMGLKK